MDADTLLRRIDFDLKAAQCAAAAQKLEQRKLRTVVESALRYKTEAKETPVLSYEYVDEDFSLLIN